MTDNFAMAAGVILSVLALALILLFRSLMQSGAFYSIRDKNLTAFFSAWLAAVVYVATLGSQVDAVRKCMATLSGTRHVTDDDNSITQIIYGSMFVLVVVPSLQVIVQSVANVARWWSEGRSSVRSKKTDESIDNL